MISCEDQNCAPSFPASWTESLFVLAASCTTTVAAALNTGLFASIVVGGVASRHPITLQLCTCAIIACAALSCHVQQVWSRDAGRTRVFPCQALGLATLFSHCAFVTLLFMELRFAHRRVVIRLLAVISWCVTAIVTLAAGASDHCSPSSTLLVFCFYALHIPLVALLLIVNQMSPRTTAAVEPLNHVTRIPHGSVAEMPRRHPKRVDIRRIVPQVLLFFLGTMPQAFMTAIEALGLRPFHSADAWCCLATTLFAVLRPLLDTAVQPELGDVTVQLIGSLCRWRRLKQISLT